MKLKRGTAKQRELQQARETTRVHIFEHKKIEKENAAAHENPTQSLAEKLRNEHKRDKFF